MLGTVLLAPAALPGLLTVEELRPEHFHRPRHQRIFAAMSELHGEGEAVDAVTVAAVLERRGELIECGGAAYLSTLPTSTPALDADRSYARLVIADARLRTARQAGLDLVAAAERRDEGGLAEVEAALGAATPTRRRRPSRLARQEAALDIIDGAGRVWPTPFPKLDDLLAGGLRPGQMTTIAGHTGHGKSMIAAQLLAHARRHGARTALYTNEMEADELDVREIAQRSGIPYGRLVRGRLDRGEHEKALAAVKGVGEAFEVIEAAGMGADEIAYDIRREGWDVCVIDLLNGLPRSSETREIDANVATLAAASRQSGAHILCCQHLNQARSVNHVYPPRPAPSDIRGSGAIHNLSNNVLLVYLVESPDDEGEPGREAHLQLAKARGGMRGRLELVFEPSRMRFLALAAATL